MPKFKPHSGMKKRIKITGKGKVEVKKRADGSKELMSVEAAMLAAH